ncbi:hypothetical protein [Roseivivax isoporae]|uniref:Uncharacterized protein n=1 Tax=Roseivivax isoporae LMG 25204 TaxID=1449351 RepID=X7FA70_9RHOB|nr:hypothetical protein [Roseivivax isoporae]ETX28996.1 hypothetical protein RISW2_03380 [Roseivivax isoporae LMG 25204]
MADTETEILEDGDIFFFFRPKVEEDDPEGRDDVQRFGFVLRPRGGGTVRMMMVGGKRLPRLSAHERLWGFVETVANRAADIEKDLRGEDYDTKTRGRRHLPAARPAGEGVYVVSLEDGQMHLSYELELPDAPGEVQAELNIAPKASFALSIKNPEKGAPRNAGLSDDEQADYPRKLQEEFRGRRFASEDVRLLDAEGGEFVLVGARDDPERAYGIDMQTEDEDYGSSEAIRRLRMVKSRHPVEPLFEGDWD